MKTRIASAILAVLMLSALFCSCGDTQVNDPVITEAVVSSDIQNTETVAPETTEYAPTNIPAGTNFNGKAVKILYWSDVERLEFEVKEETGETINDALLTRNNRVQEEIGVTFEWYGTPGNFGNQAAFVAACASSIAAGADASYDIFAGYSLTAATIALQGLSQDVAKYDIIDLSLPWWPESLTSQAKIDGKTYYVSGDISTNVLHMMYVTMYNKQILADTHPEVTDIYQIVKDGQWTLDKLIELSKGVYLDMNGDNAVSYGDRFGFQSIDLHFDCFYNGAGLKNLEVNDQGEIVLSGDFSSDRAQTLAEKLCKFLFDSGDAYGKGTNSTGSSIAAFAEDQALFVVDRAYCTSFSAMKSSTVEYGILPVVKLDTDQERYYTCMAFPYTIYSISTGSEDGLCAATAIESMAYNSYTTVTPAIFEVTMKLKYSKEANDSQMYDIIRENVYFDMGRIFTTSVNNLSYNVFRNAIKNNQGASWAATAATNAKQFKTYIKKINKSIEDLK